MEVDFLLQASMVLRQKGLSKEANLGMKNAESIS